MGISRFPARLWILVTSLLMLTTSPALALVSTDERKCIDEINKGGRKIALVQNKAIQSCVRFFSKGLLSTTLDDCMVEGLPPKVSLNVDKVEAKADKVCDGAPPSFGPSSTTSQTATAITTSFDLLSDVFGAAPVEPIMATSDPEAKCQSTMLKDLHKCEDTRLKEFRNCVRDGIKFGQIDNEADMELLCLQAPGQTEPNGKIAANCINKPTGHVSGRCVSKGVALDTAFPGCGTTDAGELVECIDEAARCRLCNFAVEVDGLITDCDLYDDETANFSCATPNICGDSTILEAETCDDGNRLSGDGCDSTCQSETGYDCTGEPSTCDEICGDGLIVGGETCDDSGTDAGDGCSATCQIESGFNCSGQPSTCAEVCGDGLIVGTETCDDGGTAAGDGCDASCQLESGFNCSGQPTVCTNVCGDGQIVSGESCDDGGTAPGDGCDGSCQLESGFNCSGQPTVCTNICGDGLIVSGEICDDGGTTPGDGCDGVCAIESGYACAGQPSVCGEVCGDGLIVGAEACDDGGTTPGDGCNGSCQLEVGFNCSGQPTSCSPICGDGLVVSGETCDDAGTTPGDGCDASCQTETGYACGGQPSTCAPVCGDGLVISPETCDDFGSAPGDGCNATCGVESGWACSGEPSTCNIFTVVINTPTHGSFTTSATTNVAGVVNFLNPAQAALTINGVSVPVGGGGTFSTTVTLDQPGIFTPIRATVTDTTFGGNAHDRVVAIFGPSVADGALSAESVALRLNDSGLDEAEPLVAQLAGSGLDLATLIPVGTTLISDTCFLDSFLGCVGSGSVSVVNPAPSISGFGIAMDSMTNFVEGIITVTDIDVNVYLNGSGLVPSCDINISANSATFDGDYALQPDPGDASTIDVNQVGTLGVSFGGFSTSFGGICDAPIIGDIIQAFLPDVEALTIDAMKDFLSDPDGAGPADGPIGDAIEAALADISISGPIGSGLGVILDTPLFDVLEDTNGITIGTNSSFTTEVGSGPGQCIPPAGAPDLTESLAVNQLFPTFGLNTPVGGLPYELGLCISSEGFNQLLKAQIECGLLVSSITELDLGGGAIPLTASTLALLIPEFGIFPPTTPFRIDIVPTIAPVVAGNGPSGELTELKVAQVLANIVQNDGSEEIVLSGAFDTNIGMDLEFAPGGLGIVLSAPLAGDITVAIIHNPLGVDEVALETTVLPPLVSVLLPDLASSLASFPLPEFLGLNLSGVEVSKNDEFLSLFADLSPAP
ncbi:MAG: DUF4215 domain-containing protein [Candidatus Binatia bacterium]|nr:DUF4215 domain-containing protein [Candidatus Binatia bacterium]